MKWNKQTDQAWSREVMTQSETWIDTLGRWGCLVTCLANILQFIGDKEITPKDVNNVIKDIKAYNYLADPGTPESQASVIVWPKIMSFYQDNIEIKLRLDQTEWRRHVDYFYIAKVRHELTGGSHYINVFTKSRKNFWCFDVEDGKLKAYKPEEIIYLHEIRRK